MRDFNNLARNPIGYRSTIPYKALILQRFLSKLLQMVLVVKLHRWLGPARLESPSKQPALTAFVGFAALSSDMALFFPIADSEQVSAPLG